MAWEPDYVTVAEFKNYVKIGATDTADDAFIALDITAASRAIDACCSYRPNGLSARRQFGKVDTAEARYYTPRWNGKSARWVIEIDDLASAAGLVIAADLDNDDVFESTITEYVLRPRAALANKRPFTQISVGINSAVQPFSWPDSIRATSDQWGWVQPWPDIIKRATLIQAHRFNKRRTAPFGVAGQPTSRTSGSTQSVLAPVDADVEEMLHSNDMVKLGWTV